MKSVPSASSSRVWFIRQTKTAKETEHHQVHAHQLFALFGGTQRHRDSRHLDGAFQGTRLHHDERNGTALRIK